mgnify:CR=1 FL=1
MSHRWSSSTLLIWLAGLTLLIFLTSAAADTPVDIGTYDLSMSRGLIEFGKGRYDKAEKLFTAALEANPGNADASYYRSQLRDLSELSPHP